MNRVFVLALIAYLASCTSARDEAADRAAIDSLRAEHVAAVNSRDADRLLNGEAEDLVYLAPDLAPIRGKQGLDALIRPLYQRIIPDISMTPQELVLRGDVAIEWGCLGGRIEQLDGGPSITNDGKYVVIYQHFAKTGWKITHSISNPGPCP